MSITNINLPYGSGEPGVGSQLSILNLQSPAVYNLIGNLGTQNWGLDIKDGDTTNQGTSWTQGIPVLAAGGEYTFDLFFIPSSAGSEEAVGLEGHGFLSGLGWIATQRQVRQYKLTWPDGAGMYFTAYFTKMPIDMSVDKVLMAKCTLKVTGQPTFF